MPMIRPMPKASATARTTAPTISGMSALSLRRCILKTSRIFAAGAFDLARFARLASSSLPCRACLRPGTGYGAGPITVPPIRWLPGQQRACLLGGRARGQVLQPGRQLFAAGQHGLRVEPPRVW